MTDGALQIPCRSSESGGITDRGEFRQRADVGASGRPPVDRQYYQVEQVIRRPCREAAEACKFRPKTGKYRLERMETKPAVKQGGGATRSERTLAGRPLCFRCSLQRENDRAGQGPRGLQ
jgi:hypothetical protein